MTSDQDGARILGECLRALESGFDRLPEFAPPLDLPAIQGALSEVVERMKDNYPYHHPLYIGQMLKPPHPVARLAYAMAMFLNPNNHALDGGRASSVMEKEAIAGIARMFGWEDHLGHLCGGGTMANFEALWIGRELRPGRAVAASAQAHYTHSRLSAVLGIPFRKLPVDSRGRMDITALEDGARQRRDRHGGRDARYDRRRCGRSSARGPRPARALRLPDPRQRRVRRVFHTGGEPRPQKRGPRSTTSPQRIRSSSIRTSTGSSRMAADASSSATRPSVGSTATTHPIPTSPQPSCTSARSRSNARGPEPRP